jgi:hypothetical protein
LRLRAPFVVLVASLTPALVACGGSDKTVSVPAATTAAPGGSTSPQAPTTPQKGTTNPGGAEHTAREQTNGGSQPVRSDASWVVVRGRLLPRTITVPSFIAVDVRLHNSDPRRHLVVIRANRRFVIVVPPFAAQVRRLISGQRAGTYPVLVDGRPSGALVFGGEPGP